MKNILFSVFALTFVACGSTLPNFVSMNDIEIAAYNRTVIRSRIPRRRCQTRMAWQQDIISAVGQVGTAGSGQDQIIVN